MIDGGTNHREAPEPALLLLQECNNNACRRA